MKEYIKNNNALLSSIPFLNIQSSLPQDGTDDELIFIPSSGIYMWRNSQWEIVVPLGGSGTDAIIGEIIPYYGATAADKSSDGWLLCDGSTYNYNDYPDLALLIDNTLVPGSTFQVPDLREKYLTMIGTNGTGVFTNGDVYTLGQTKQPSIEAHNHGTLVNSHQHTNVTVSHYHAYNTNNAIVRRTKRSDSDMKWSSYEASSATSGTKSAQVTLNSATPTADVQLSGSVTQPKTVCCYYYIRAV